MAKKDLDQETPEVDNEETQPTPSTDEGVDERDPARQDGDSDEVESYAGAPEADADDKLEEARQTALRNSANDQPRQ